MRRLILIFLVLALGNVLPAQTFFLETFNQGIPATWTAQNGGSTADTWMGTSGGFSGQYLDGSEFVFVNSDAAGSASSICLDELLISPVANTAGQSVLLLEFDQYFRHIGQTDSGMVEVFDGTAWRRVAAFAGSTGSFGTPNHQVINVSTYANPAMQVRFRYNDGCNWAWYWAVDNVLLYAPLTSDAGITAIDSPATNGRQLTSIALSSTETVTVTVENFGVDTLFNAKVAFRINGGTPIPTETVPAPIPPLTSVSYTFIATANLAAIGTYEIEAWTDLNLDANPANDTLWLIRRQLPNAAAILPLCQGFENAPDTVGASNFVGAIAGLPEVDFFTSGGAGGRLRTAAGANFPNNGMRAITLDKSPTGAPNAINYVLLTYNLDAYDASQDMVLFAYSVSDHGDEVHVNDSVWVRGSDSSAWIGIAGWNNISGGNNGTWFDQTGIDLSVLLNTRGQDFSSSFQIRLGQEDNFAASSTIASDGVSFDDICLTQIVPINTGVTDITHPSNMDCGDSLVPVVLVIENFGLDTLSNIPVQVTVTGASAFTILDTLVGPLFPGGNANLVVQNGSAFSGGSFNICAFTQLAGDSLPQDDSTCIQVMLMSPQRAIVPSDTLCQGDSTLLQIIAPNPVYMYTWWDSATGGNKLHTATSLQTPPLLADTTYYVEANSAFRSRVGATDNSFATGANYTIMSDGLRFDVQQTLVVDTVFVYPNSGGTVVVNVMDAANNLVGSASAMVSGAGRQAIPVGITVYPGNSYTMNALGTSTGGLYRNDTSAVFPFMIPNVVVITNTINGLGANGFYYFFYDWRVTVPGCAGPRTPVSVNVLTNPPVAGFAATVTQTILAFADTSGGTVQSWQWDFGDGNSSNQQNPTHTYLQPGTYPICLTVANSCGIDSICDTVTVCAPLVAGFTVQDTGLSVSFADTSTNALTWSWTLGDGAVDSVANPQHTYVMDGVYSVCLRVENVCMQVDSICDSLAFCLPVGADFSFVQQTGNGLSFVFSDLSVGMVTAWVWDFGDGGTSALQNPNHVFTQTGNLNVQLVVTNLCGDKDTLMQSLQVVGLEDALFHALEIFPNPNSGRFSLRMGNVSGEAVRIRVFDLPGRMVWGKELLPVNGGLEEEIDLGDVAKGMYWLEILVDGRRAMRRVLVE